MLQIVHGNCLDHLPQLSDNSIDLIIADPPYNVYDADAVKSPFQRRNKDVTWDRFDTDFLQFSQAWITTAITKLKPTGSLFVFGGVNYTHGHDLLELLPILRKQIKFVNMIVWYYHNGASADRFFANRYELIAWFAKSDAYKFNLDAVRTKYDQRTLRAYLKDKRLNPDNVEKGKNPTNVWEIGRLNGNDTERVDHPTQKPEAIIQRIIEAVTDPHDLVVDPFLGSGTTAKVCANIHRDCIGYEIDDHYYRVALARCHLQHPSTVMDRFLQKQ